MSLPIRNLPLVQNWSCHSCGDCCRTLEAVITDAEKERIETLGLHRHADIPPEPWFDAKDGGLWTIRHRPEGGCIFLTAQNRCRLHEDFGEEVKPFACRFFPFLLIPAGTQWRVGMRFACPSVVENRGRPLAEQEADLTRFVPLLERHTGRAGASAPAPFLETHQHSTWTDSARLVHFLGAMLQDPGDRVERRLRKCLALARTCKEAKLSKIDRRQNEFLNLVRASVDDEVPRDPADVPEPTRIGRVLFRTLLAIYARKDRGEHRGPAVRSRLGRLKSAWRFVRGKGPVPRVNSLIPDIDFADVDQRPALPPEVDPLLERYYRIKLESLQFCGPPNFGLGFWAGLESLAFTFPVIQWLARLLPAASPLEACQRAILLVDDHFGGNPALGFRHHQYMLRTLGERGEIERLIAFYARNG